MLPVSTKFFEEPKTLSLVYNLAVHVTLIYIPAHGAGGGLAYKLKG